MIVIVDLKMGNTGSVFNMLKRLGIEVIISSDCTDILKAEKLIISGIGSFDQAMKSLEDLKILSLLNEKVLKSKTPILGICLGMQLFTSGSEEGKLPGLGWIDGKTVKFRFEKEKDLKIPHMGWNTLRNKPDTALFSQMPEDSRFYFAHSYYVVCNKEENIAALTSYGYDFVSVLQKENIMGVQFHPEKSHLFGMRLLKNFSEYTC